MYMFVSLFCLHFSPSLPPSLFLTSCFCIPLSFCFVLLMSWFNKLISWIGLHEEMKLDMQRIWKRNLGRDDRCIADNGKEVLPMTEANFAYHFVWHIFYSNIWFIRLDFLSWMRMLYELCLAFLCGRLLTLINQVEREIRRS